MAFVWFDCYIWYISTRFLKMEGKTAKLQKCSACVILFIEIHTFEIVYFVHECPHIMNTWRLIHNKLMPILISKILIYKICYP